MDFDFQWLLFALPLTFALGWFASRTDLRHWRREQRDTRQAYIKGLNLLLNEQHDKAIDAFIEAVQQDPATVDLHFALGNLFRRRGEHERAVRVHEHLLQRTDLPAMERVRAQNALAQDFMKAGLFDRAEQAFRALDGTVFDTEAQLALLTLFERSRDWRDAIDVAHKLERRGAGSFASRVAHYWCEIAEEADAQLKVEVANEALQKARQSAPRAARPLTLSGRRLAHHGEHKQAFQVFSELLAANPGRFTLIAHEYAVSAMACGEQTAALDQLQRLHQRSPSINLLSAMTLLDTDPKQHRNRLLCHLREQPTLSAAQQFLQAASDGSTLENVEMLALCSAVDRAAKSLQRYRCAACGFEARHCFWQCPGCMTWDSYPPQRLEDL